MTIKEGEKHGISRFPNFHRSGSVRGMKSTFAMARTAFWCVVVTSSTTLLPSLKSTIKRLSKSPTDMNTDIDFMNIAEGDKAFVEEFENFVNGKVSNPEKTGMAMTTMHRYLQQQAFKVTIPEKCGSCLL